MQLYEELIRVVVFFQCESPLPVIPSPRQSRSQSLTQHTLSFHSNKLNKHDVTENVYIDAARMFAKALGLPSNKAHLLNDKLQLHNCNSGTVLLEEGAVDASIILLLHGSVSVTMKNQENQDVSVYYMVVGEMTGSLSVLTGEPNLFAVKTKTLSRVAVLSRQNFYE